MRHRRTRHKLNRSASHRKSLGANLATALLTHGRIQTTLPKARLAREVAEKAITLGKDGSLHARRQAIALLRNKDVTYDLFDRIAPAFEGVDGGYTRTLKLGPRPGDAAEMVLLELTAIIEAEAEAAEAPAPAVDEPQASADEPEAEAEEADAEAEAAEPEADEADGDADQAADDAEPEASAEDDSDEQSEPEDDADDDEDASGKD